MNKSELINAIASETGLSKKDSDAALVATLKAITKAVKKESVQLIGFGTFKTTARKARTGINPQTKAKIKIPARKVMTFKASKNPKY